MRILIFLLIIVGPLNAQEIYFDGIVYDSKSKETIPFVNLSFLNTLKGTSSDEEGHFFMDLPSSFLEKQVHISSLGYKDTVVDAQQIFKTKKINLIPESFELNEVVVSQTLGDSDVLNPISSYSVTSGFSSSSTPWVLAMYFPNIGSQKKYVEKVTIFFQKNPKFKRESAKFRIRLYNVDPKTKQPTNDILYKSIILETEKGKDYASIDLTSLGLKMSQQGVYVGLEWLFVPHNWYKNSEKHNITNKVVVEDRFAPTFGGMYTKNQNYKVMVYGMGKWTDFVVKSKDKSKNFIPAMSLKLSKK
ncbi:carboxypeptidase-like regulatory domain-containing protein [Cellulophaga sp. HaHaR_3_176]|uniref:carboxypeptidase-like regulatory domain-containing protein n=1 Tax=Cellulophaga sp. HaHaR_3_176 TaxID=1942464 RepID=UPI001C1FC0D3|nr:carboxypeptidase-like regulatory domain-containing protein [Cellulophaga sp. HaHaR_3_176]QWX84464.1 carboxypeptidase-like regulatory domain-containing protein [Cellulophaga sp. HaHaR_3_176]